MQLYFEAISGLIGGGGEVFHWMAKLVAFPNSKMFELLPKIRAR